MKQPISKDRTELSHLLTQLISDPENTDLRYRAAKLALRVSLEERDLRASDLLENLLAHPPAAAGLTPPQQHLYLRATARAARRAIAAMPTSTSRTGTRSTLNQTCNDPEALQDLIRERIKVGQLQLAQCISRVGVSRHPADNRLREIQEEISMRLQETLLPAPIPFPQRGQ